MQTNKISLTAKLGENGFKVILFPSDGDTTIVKTALDIKNGSVTILANDTVILCLLIHHVYFFHEDTDVFPEEFKN